MYLLLICNILASTCSMKAISLLEPGGRGCALIRGSKEPVAVVVEVADEADGDRGYSCGGMSAVIRISRTNALSLD